MTRPALMSLALKDIPRPDFADVSIRPLPDGAPLDPETWARAIFNFRAPGWVRVLMGVRQVLVWTIGVSRGNAAEAFAVRERAGDEVLLAADDRHLDFRVGVGVDPVTRLVRVTTTVRLHGWRGRLYFAPVRVLHPPIVQAMMRSAARRLA